MLTQWNMQFGKYQAIVLRVIGKAFHGGWFAKKPHPIIFSLVRFLQSVDPKGLPGVFGHLTWCAYLGEAREEEG